MNVSYGVVRDVDLDIQENEIIEQFRCEHKILAMRRLNRLSDNRQWIDSAVIRLAFNSSPLPSYIIGYGCRSKVEPYDVPVTQCSGCWKYGHTYEKTMPNWQN